MKKILISSIVLAVFLWLPARGADVTLDYAKTRGKIVIDYPDSLRVKIENVNRLDYKYFHKITYEVPKQASPLIPSPISRPEIGTLKAPEPADCEKINKALKERVLISGQKNTEGWFNTNANILAPIKDEINEKNPLQEAGFLAIGENEIADTLLKTGPGGVIIVEITAIPGLWSCKSENGVNEINSHFAEDSNKDGLVDETEINSFLDKYLKDQAEDIKAHCSKRAYRIEFKKPKGIIYSFGPYMAILGKNVYGPVKNPNYVEGSSEPGKKNKLYIGYQEQSGIVYGVAAFWNAPMISDSIGLSWGVAYNLQSQIDTSVSGLVGFYIRNPKVPALFQAGVSFGFVNELPEGFKPYETPIGENEVIPLTKKLVPALFLSLSFGI
jgi:hypothetical protein